MDLINERYGYSQYWLLNYYSGHLEECSEREFDNAIRFRISEFEVRHIDKFTDEFLKNGKVEARGVIFHPLTP